MRGQGGGGAGTALQIPAGKARWEVRRPHRRNAEPAAGLEERVPEQPALVLGRRALNLAMLRGWVWGWRGQLPCGNRWGRAAWEGAQETEERREGQRPSGSF